jgi:hypothetical protein
VYLSWAKTVTPPMTASTPAIIEIVRILLCFINTSMGRFYHPYFFIFVNFLPRTRRDFSA